MYQPTVFPEPYKAKLASTQRDPLIDLKKEFTKETNYITAIDSYKNVLRTRPNDQRIMNDLVLCYRFNRQYQEAEAIGYQLLAHAPDNIEACKNMALIYFDQGTIEMAELFARLAKKQLEQQRHNNPSTPEDAGIYNNLGLVFLKSSRPREALEQFAKALEIKPDHLDSLINIGALAHQYRDYARAQAAYEKVLQFEPENDTAARGLAYAVFGSGNAQRTIELMNKLLARDPDEIKAYYVLGVTYEMFLHDFAKAIYFYEQYISKMGFALNSNDPVKERLAATRAKSETAIGVKKYQ
jgi:tetratricopeptide (TPR) repeat protein